MDLKEAWEIEGNVPPGDVDGKIVALIRIIRILETDLGAGAAMLAKQCDLARQAEQERDEARGRLGWTEDERHIFLAKLRDVTDVLPPDDTKGKTLGERVRELIAELERMRREATRTAAALVRLGTADENEVLLRRESVVHIALKLRDAVLTPPESEDGWNVANQRQKTKRDRSKT